MRGAGEEGERERERERGGKERGEEEVTYVYDGKDGLLDEV